MAREACPSFSALRIALRAGYSFLAKSAAIMAKCLGSRSDALRASSTYTPSYFPNE
jgi:hypothetical protein